jgi:hypothetical protein
MNDNEQKAWELAADRDALERRLRDAKAYLYDGSRFGKGRFDFDLKRLVGNNGLYLQWLPRLHPEHPESYDNQQTNIGCVIFCDTRSGFCQEI